MTKLLSLFAFLYLACGSSFASEIPKLAKLHPNMQGYTIQNADFTFEYYVASLDSPAEVKSFIKKYQALVAEEDQNISDVEHVVDWVNAPFQNRAINSLNPETAFDPESVAIEAASGIQGATVDRIDLSSEQTKEIQKKYGNSPIFKSIRIAVSSYSFKGLRIGVNTINKYRALITQSLPFAAVVEHSASIFVWCTLSSVLATRINNFVNHNTFTDDDTKAKLYQYVPKDNSEKSVVTFFKNLLRGTDSKSRYFRFGITEGLFLGPTLAIEAMINVANHLAPFGPHVTAASLTIQLAVATVLCTAAQGTSEIANDRYRQWARLAGFSEKSIKFYSDAGFAIASVLSVTGGLNFLAGEYKVSLLYLSQLAIGSGALWFVFHEKINTLVSKKLLEQKVSCDEALNAAQIEIDFKDAG